MSESKSHTFFLGVLQSVVGAIVMIFLVALWQKLLHHSVDWYGILGLFVLTCALLFLAIRLSSRQSKGLSDREFNEKLDRTRKEIEAQVSSLIDAKINTPAVVNQAEQQEVPAPTVTKLISPLQDGALTLSMKLLSFIEAQGPPPIPKYTRKEIDLMPSAEMKSLILENDKDFDFACEYYYGGNIAEGGPQTADEMHKFMMARFMLLHPWYEKVRASYELEFRVEVERMYNRFAIEGLGDDILKVPVDGKMGRENIRAIASKLWELAYKVREKEVSIENP